MVVDGQRKCGLEGTRTLGEETQNWAAWRQLVRNNELHKKKLYGSTTDPIVTVSR